jgi:hypothetical protein
MMEEYPQKNVTGGNPVGAKITKSKRRALKRDRSQRSSFVLPRFGRGFGWSRSLRLFDFMNAKKNPELAARGGEADFSEGK